MKFYEPTRCFIAKKKDRLCWRWIEQDYIQLQNLSEYMQVRSQAEALFCKLRYTAVGSFYHSTNSWTERVNYDEEGRIEKATLYICNLTQVAVYAFNRYASSEEVNFNELNKSTATGNKGQGRVAYEEINKIIKEELDIDSLYQNLAGSYYKKDWEAIKKCVPNQIQYISGTRNQAIYGGCYKADVSSAFPSQLQFAIPTLHRRKRIHGRVEPTKDYPFAFYINSGYLSIYNELNTEVDNKSAFMAQTAVKSSNISPEDDITILCKASDINLGKVFQKLYSQKLIAEGEEKDIIKLIMNATIGYWQKNSSPNLSFLSAITIARNNHRMLSICNTLIKERNIVLYIATDSVIWQGKYSKVATEDKYLGSFTYEIKDGDYYGVAVGAYQIRDKENMITKCSYIIKEKKKYIAFGELPEPKKNKFEEK